MARPLYITGIARFIATGGGVGYSPIAPGTCGTLITVPLAWALTGLPVWWFGAVTGAVIVVGIWAAEVADEHWRTHDSCRIVVDEVAGYLVTVALIDRRDWLMLLAGFVLFRVLDMAKPPPIRWFEEHLPGGAGVVLDDVAAGIIGCALLYAFAGSWAPAWLRSLL